MELEWKCEFAMEVGQEEVARKSHHNYYLIFGIAI